MTLKEAIASVEFEMRQIVVSMGFDEREHGGKIVNVLWYAMRDEDPRNYRPRYRVQVFVDGDRVAGVEV